MYGLCKEGQFESDVSVKGRISWLLLGVGSWRSQELHGLGSLRGQGFLNKLHNIYIYIYICIYDSICVCIYDIHVCIHDIYDLPLYVGVRRLR